MKNRSDSQERRRMTLGNRSSASLSGKAAETCRPSSTAAPATWSGAAEKGSSALTDPTPGSRPVKVWRPSHGKVQVFPKESVVFLVWVFLVRHHLSFLSISWHIFGQKVFKQVKQRLIHFYKKKTKVKLNQWVVVEVYINFFSGSYNICS